MATTLDLSSESVREIAKTDLARATEMARQLVAADPTDEEAARLINEFVRQQAAETSRPPVDGPVLAPAVAEASRLLNHGEEERAEILLRQHLSQHPDDVQAMVRMADIAARCEFHDNAERILHQAHKLDPQCVDVLLALATLRMHLSLMQRHDRGDAALELIERALEIEPQNALAVALETSIYVRFRRFEEAIASCQRRLKFDPLNWQVWANVGQLLNSVGKAGEAAAAVRTCLAINPCYGFGWWELTNVKLAKLFAFDIAEMERVLDQETLDPSAASAIHFTLGKAFHQREQRMDAARHWQEGNRIKGQVVPHDAAHIETDVDASIVTFKPDYFVRRAGQGEQRGDPIFIIGMQRAGSTLVEQILASHPAVEATEELFLILKLAQDINARNPGQTWQQSVAVMGSAEVQMLGARILELAQHFRTTDRPLFIDKNPANWRFTGLIATVLPNAKFIDVRRNPMDCCFANYTHYYEKGVSFAYSQRDIGRYYADYVRLMRHFDEVRPGLVHRVIYEDLVEDLEGSVRHLLDYLGLPFDEACLRFFETDRPVLTPSAQQVRQPINRSGIGRWRDYEPWLGELRDALGGTLDDWRN